MGHHSERRHRRELDRMDTAMRKGIEAGKVARDSRLAAANADETGISIQDDDATALLAEKIKGLEDRQRHISKATPPTREDRTMNLQTNRKAVNLTSIVIEQGCPCLITDQGVPVTPVPCSCECGGFVPVSVCLAGWGAIQFLPDHVSTTGTAS